MEINDKGAITGKYAGTQLGTVDKTTNQDGTSSSSGKFMQTTNKGEMIVATGSGTGKPATSKGIVKIRGEGGNDMAKLVEMDEQVTLSKQMENDVDGSVILINKFTVNAGDVDQFLKAW